MALSSRILLLAAALLAACSRLPERPLIPVPPATLPGGWQRVAFDTPGLRDIPSDLAALKPAHRVRAAYRAGQVNAGVDAFALPSQASAFEAQQKWRPEPGAIAFQHGSLFLICRAEGLPTPELARFSQTLEDRWLGGRK